MEFLRTKRSSIKRLCDQHHVADLYVFGSVARGESNLDSDIDLLVGFHAMDPLSYADNFFSLKEALTELLEREVDLVEEQGIKNPILQRAIDRDKVHLYERESSKVAS